MPDIVDCRKCRYFIPRRNMDGVFLEAALKYVRRHRPGEPLLGWCDKRKAPVTFYHGKCRFYEPIPPKEYPKITDYAG